MNKILAQKSDHPLISDSNSTIVNLENSLIVEILGINNENLDYCEKKLNVQIFQKGNIVIISGNKKDRFLVKNTIIRLSKELKKTDQKKQGSFQEILNMEINNDSVNVNIQNFTVAKTSKLSITGKTPKQNEYLEVLHSKQIIFGIGPAGTGKTYLAVAAAVAQLLEGRYDRIILSRPAVEAGEKLGFLPGDLSEKVNPYLQPIYDALNEIVGVERVTRLIEKKIIEIAPLAYMRGRTLNDAFIILDEGQNTTIAQMEMFLTRIGFGSKAVVTGDTSQIDLPRDSRSGLKDCLEFMPNVNGVHITNFKPNDVMRHKIVKDIIREYDKRKK